MNRINNYVNEVLSYIVADNKMKKRIREDLIHSSMRLPGHRILTV